VKAARDVDRRVRPEDDANRIDQVEVGAGNGGDDRAINVGLIAAGDSADHVADRSGTASRGKGSALVDRRVGEAELAETVKEVAADLLSEIGADRIVRPDQRLRRRETAVDRDVLRGSGPRRESRKHAGADNGEPTSQPHAAPSHQARPTGDRWQIVSNVNRPVNLDLQIVTVRRPSQHGRSMLTHAADNPKGCRPGGLTAEPPRSNIVCARFTANRASSNWPS